VRAHERIHSDARPYACRRCHKAFKTSECLWHHENRSKSCGSVGAQQQQEQLLNAPPPVDRHPSVRSRGRKRGRHYPELLPVKKPREPTTTNCLPSLSTCIPAPSTITNAGGFQFPVATVQIPGLSLMSSAAARASTGFSTVDCVTAPLTTSLLAPPSSARLDPPGVDRRLNAPLGGSSIHREGLVLLANCAVSRPDDDVTRRCDDVTGQGDDVTRGRGAVTQVKVEQEVVLADYELTAMNSPEEESFYERKRMAADEISTPTSASALTDFHVTSPQQLVTGSRSKSRSPAGGGGEGGAALMSVDGRFECRKCGRQFVSQFAYNKHVLVHRLNNAFINLRFTSAEEKM